MKQMISTPQNFNPTNQSLNIISKCAERLAPNDKSLSGWHDGYLRTHKDRLALDLDLIVHLANPEASILELGSIPLVLTSALSESKYQVTGVDIAPERYKETIDSLGIEVVKCNIETEKLPFEDDVFDFLIFNELFEHLRINPIFSLKEAFRVLKPGGIMTLSSPNLKSMNGLYNYLFKNRAYSCSGNIYNEYSKLEKLGHMGHVREYTSTEVVEFLENIGFEVPQIVYRGRFGTNIKQLLARIFPSLRPFISYTCKKAK